MEGLEKCPKCRDKMEEGTLRIRGSASASGALWGPRNWGMRLLTDKPRGERIRWGLVKTDFIGLRCSKCKLILIYYGYREEKEE